MLYQVFLNIPIYEIKTTKSILHVVLYTSNHNKFLTITDLKKLMEKKIINIIKNKNNAHFDGGNVLNCTARYQ